jgi:hypothetical protein
MSGLQSLGDGAATKLAAFRGSQFLMPNLKELNDTPGHILLLQSLLANQEMVCINIKGIQHAGDHCKTLIAVFGYMKNRKISIPPFIRNSIG